MKIREIIDQGLIGEIVTVDHRENILWWHFAHSFVRGNWRNVKSSTFSLLAKSCHDIDLIMYWMGDQKCTKIQSFGSLKHFKNSGAPLNAGKTCYQCPEAVEKACPYSAKKIYDLGYILIQCQFLYRVSNMEILKRLVFGVRHLILNFYAGNLRAI